MKNVYLITACTTRAPTAADVWTPVGLIVGLTVGLAVLAAIVTALISWMCIRHHHAKLVLLLAESKILELSAVLLQRESESVFVEETTPLILCITIFF